MYPFQSDAHLRLGIKWDDLVAIVTVAEKYFIDTTIYKSKSYLP
jgi:hypothetical protein